MLIQHSALKIHYKCYSTPLFLHLTPSPHQAPCLPSPRVSFSGNPEEAKTDTWAHLYPTSNLCRGWGLKILSKNHTRYIRLSTTGCCCAAAKSPGCSIWAREQVSVWTRGQMRFSLRSKWKTRCCCYLLLFKRLCSLKIDVISLVKD